MRILTLLVCLSLSSMYAQQSIPAYGMTKVEHTWEPYTGANFSINRLSYWEISEDKTLGASFIFYVAQIAEDPNFRENMTLLVQDLKGQEIDLDKFVSISEDQIAKLMTNGKIHESQRIKGDLYESHKVVFTGDQGIYKLKFEQRYIIHQNKAYILTFTALENEFDLFIKDIHQSLNSFKFLP